MRTRRGLRGDGRVACRVWVCSPGSPERDAENREEHSAKRNEQETHPFSVQGPVSEVVIVLRSGERSMSSYSARNATLPPARAIDLIPDHLAQAGDIETQAAKSHEIWSREQGARRHRMIQILRRRIERAT